MSSNPSHPASSGRSSLFGMTGLVLFLLLSGLIAGGVYWFYFYPADDVPEQVEEAPPLFEDVTQLSGIRFTYRNGQEAGHFAIIESLGGGVGLIDFDGDGLLDIFVPGGGYYVGNQLRGHPCKLYKNMGNFKFKDVTKEVGLDKVNFYTHGCAVADYDCDGWPDLLVTGWGRVALYRNVSNGKGGRKFIDVSTKANLTQRVWSTSAGFADLDGDGFPDIYVCQYVNWSIEPNMKVFGLGTASLGPISSPAGAAAQAAASAIFAVTSSNNPYCSGYTKGVKRDVCPPKTFQGLEHVLYRNNGKGAFKEVSRQAGLNYYGKKNSNNEQVEVGKGLGVILVDVNNDGRPDIYVANDTVDNFLFMNRTPLPTQGKIHPTRLEEVAFDKGVARDGNGGPNGSMGLAAGDFDRSGNASIFVTNYEDEMHALYRNLGKERFLFATEETGIVAIGQKYVGFGTAFVDIDNDGWEDLVVCNGHVIRHPIRAGIKQRPVLFRNSQGKRFEIMTSEGGSYFQSEHVARGLAVGDLDNDGRADLVINHINEPVTLLRNIAGNKTNRNHWLGIVLKRKGNRCPVGSRVVIEVDGVKRTTFAKGGGSYLSASDPRHLFGLGKATKIDRVTVFWSWGQAQVWEGNQFTKVDKYWLLEEGKTKTR